MSAIRLPPSHFEFLPYALALEVRESGATSSPNLRRLHHQAQSYCMPFSCRTPLASQLGVLSAVAACISLLHPYPSLKSPRLRQLKVAQTLRDKSADSAQRPPQQQIAVGLAREP